DFKADTESTAPRSPSSRLTVESKKIRAEPRLSSRTTHPVGNSANLRSSGSLDGESLVRVEVPLFDALRKAEIQRGFRLDPRVITALRADGDVPIIVAGNEALPDLASRLAGTRHADLHHYRHIPFAALEAGPQALLELVQTEAVASIELDEKHHPSLIESIPLIGADVADQNGFDGTGHVIAILDTGVDLDHPAFAGRTVEEACFSRQGDCPGGGEREFGPGTGGPCSFGCGHGTLVAAVALGMDEEDDRHGVAPEAGLISIQIFSNDGGEPAAWTSDILAGLEHVYDLSLFHPIAAASLSLGGEPYSNQDDCDMANGSRKAIIDQLRSAGIATVVSSGNEGLTSEISSPACISSAISVGSSRKNDLVSSFSNSADFLSLLAPGDRISTATEGGGYGFASGTSIAAPHVAGAFAAIREADANRSVDEILFALQLTGRPIVDSRNEITTPRIDVQATIEYLTDDPQDEEDLQEPDEPEANDRAFQDTSSTCGLVGLELCLPLALWGWPLAKSRKSPRQRRTA
ncbi:MAG: S8 family serine peptidase, partial [Myxococcota bacterium]